MRAARFQPLIREGLEQSLEECHSTEVLFSPETELRFAAAELQAWGVRVGIDPVSPEGALLIAEAINWAAKALDESFYRLKPVVWVAAASLDGVSAVYCDGIVYLDESRSGVSAHDPFGEIMHLARAVGVDIPETSVSWDGFVRQPYAFLALRSACVRRILSAYAHGEVCKEQATRVLTRLAALLSQRTAQ